MAAAHVVEHPLLQLALTELREAATPPDRFRAALERAAALLAPEALRDFPVRAREVRTPLETASGHAAASEAVIVPILRAGLGMVDAFLRLLPGARVCHIGVRRDERSLRPVEYYARLPHCLEGCHVVVLDPMLATGGSVVAAVDRLEACGATAIVLASVIAAPEGLRALARAHPNVRVVVAAIDRGLDDRGFIRPGLGDAGDRSFGA